MPPRRRGRPTRRAAARPPTPDEPSDQEMQEVSASEAESPVQDEDAVDEEPLVLPDNDDVNDEDAPATPDNESEASVSRAGSPPVTRGRGRGRGRGRRGRPRVRPLGSERASKEGSQDASDTGTPRPRRGGWRGRGFGAGRWANKRAGGQRQDQLPQDAEGNQLPIEADEAVVPEDPEGETKVDKNGRLLGGREYRVRIFTVLGREQRLYMLSTEPARCIGFRDSYLFFQKHRVLYKIILSDEEKMDLIERDLMPHSYKGRSIGVVTARSVFREFGAKIVIGGRNVVDDYFPDRARESGVIEGELTVPEDPLPPPGQEYNRNQYVAWHGASAVYHTSGPAMPLQAGEKIKRKIPITGANWMLEHARQASRFNSRISQERRAVMDGVYDVHTNMMLLPRITQPTHARWERVPDHSRSGHAPFMFHDSESDELSSEYLAPPPNPFLPRNYLVADSVYITPPVSGLGIPGIDGSDLDLSTAGLIDVPEEVIAALPEDCRADFMSARAREAKWKKMWRNEQTDGRRPGADGRQDMRITYDVWTTGT